jgi:hypothetical protein
MSLTLARELVYGLLNLVGGIDVYKRAQVLTLLS